MTQGGGARERSSRSNRSLCPVMADFCLLPARSSAFASFLVETRCIIDGWLIGNSITRRLLGWETVGHRCPVRTIELECRRGGKVSFRDASPLSADLLGMPNGHCLVQLLTDDLPNCSCWLDWREPPECCLAWMYNPWHKHALNWEIVHILFPLE